MRDVRMPAFWVMLSVCLCCAAACADTNTAHAKADLMARMLKTDVTDWCYHVGEVDNGQDPKLDDSGWQRAQGSAFHWGTQPLAWLRTRIAVPKDVSGISVAGGRITFRCGVDDDGTLYVNGAKAQDFHWDQGTAVLTENAQPGQTFDIAIRNTNGPGDGRLLLARLEYVALAPVVDATNAYLAKYSYARDLLSAASDESRPRYEACLVKAMDVVKLDVLSTDTEGYIASLKTAEKELDPINELVRGINLHLVGHAHIDMNWLWLWPETLEVCRNTFNSVSQLMDDFPGFKFSQSQPAVYAAMKETAPEVFEKIKERVKRGQWDTTVATTWTEGDENMSSGESIVRSILYGKRFMRREFGIESDMGWEPDTFGHVATMPQILAKSGIKYYYFMRCDNGHPLFWWESPDGSRVLAYCYGPYNKGLDAGVGSEALRFAKQTGVNNYMHVYGVGDHGGGPTREMLNNANDLSARADFPKLRFSTPRDYFQTVLKSKTDLPVWKSDLNTVFQGCYTSHADVKRWNRECENLLPAAEVFSVIAETAGGSYPKADFEKSWQKTCFNQFHDILCGTAIHGSYEYSGNLRNEIVAQGRSQLDKSLRAVVSHINTTGKGSPIVVFNPLAWDRTDSVSVPSPFGVGEVPNAAVTDSAGRSYPAQVSDGTLSFTARNVPAMGYKVFWVSRDNPPPSSGVKVDGTQIENQFYCVKIDASNGRITSILDKINEREVVPSGMTSAALQLRHQRNVNAWEIGQTASVEDVPGKASVTETGPARATISVEGTASNSRIKQQITLCDAVPRIDIHTVADWQEVSGGGKLAPLLKQGFGIDFTGAKAFVDIPFGSIERKMDGSEVPAQKWVDVSSPDYGLSVLNDCKYGVDFKDGMIWMSLLNSPADPDPRPDQGEREWTLSLYPHKGDWRRAGTPRRGFELNQPLVAINASAHNGTLPVQTSYLSVSANNVIVTALKEAEDDDSLVLRFYESDGRPCRTTIRTSLPARSYQECDLMERPIGEKLDVKDGAFNVNVGRWEIKTYRLMR